MSFLDAVRAGVFTVPGDGDVDFKPIFDILAENNYERLGLFVGKLGRILLKSKSV